MKPELVPLYTPSGERLAADPDRIPWDAYPRPQLRRDSYLCLNGWWDFAVTDGDAAAVYDRRIRVPYCPESLLSGIGEVPTPGGRLCYRRLFTLPDGFVQGRVLLHIGAADQITHVYVNDSLVGEHVGGYDPITVDITAYLQAENTLRIEVEDHLPDTTLPYGKQCHKRGGMWYTPVSGIWQTVWLESVPKNYVKSIDFTTTKNTATVRVDGVSEGTLTVTTPLGEVTLPVVDGVAEFATDTPRLWCPEDPYLYECTLETAEDTVQSYFALRTLTTETVDGVPRLCLNGKPVFLHAVLDQGYWSDGLFTPPLPTCYEWDVVKMQELGFNTLRKHIKIEAERFYYDCDRLGMLVWQDMVNNGDYSFFRDTALPTVGLKRLNDKHLHRDKNTRAAFEAGMAQTVRQLNNHPSIVGWTIFNEGWGQFDSQRMYETLKALDSTRFIDTASGWFKGADSDLVSEHVYFKPYRFKPGQKPVFLSEFGGYSYKPEGHVSNTKQTYGYRLFDDAAAYMDAVEKLYRQEIVPAVAKGLCGAVYTQLSDVEDETNGLYSYDRRVCKVDAERMRCLAAELTKQIENGGTNQ
ncbi:MAG: glycoside hydrolase family 2 [Clostridia bacterium]|nr:glycoside hydrolase family 2 [Clostridia bacterium]